MLPYSKVSFSTSTVSFPPRFHSLTTTPTSAVSLRQAHVGMLPCLHSAHQFRCFYRVIQQQSKHSIKTGKRNCLASTPKLSFDGGHMRRTPSFEMPDTAAVTERNGDEGFDFESMNQHTAAPRTAATRAALSHGSPVSLELGPAA